MRKTNNMKEVAFQGEEEEDKKDTEIRPSESRRGKRGMILAEEMLEKR